ncbi:MAG: hypothetical protein R3F35_06065 [Myxococcota bacterium]
MTPSAGTRFAVVSLLALALMIMGLLLRTSRSVDPCRTPERLADLTPLPEATRVHTFDPEEGSELTLRIAGDLKRDPEHVSFVIARGHAVSTMTGNWTRLLRHPLDARETWTERLEVDGEPVDVTWASERVGAALHFAGRIQFVGLRSVRSPVWTQIRSSLHQLMHGIEPLTLYVVEVITAEEDVPLRQARSTEWLTAAARHFRSTCGSDR